jgi:hypothetical protein
MVKRLKDKNNKNQGKLRERGVAGKQGFEPRFHDPESCVLPLDDFPAGSLIIIDIPRFFNQFRVPEEKGIGYFFVFRERYNPGKIPKK